MSRSVLLPHPEGPKTDTNSPWPTSSVTPSSAWTSPSVAA